MYDQDFASVVCVYSVGPLKLNENSIRLTLPKLINTPLKNTGSSITLQLYNYAVILCNMTHIQQHKKQTSHTNRRWTN